MHTKTDTAFTYAASIKYGYLKQWYPWSQDIMKIMQMAIPIARDMMDLPAYLNIHMGPLQKPHAVYQHTMRKVTIDPRKAKTLGRPLISLCHELVHAEQFHQGRMSLGIRTLQWMGKPIKMELRDYEKYKAQPWEAEAFEREVILAKTIAEKIKERL